MSPFQCCAVVGAGLMGTQIAVALAAGVEQVRLFDSDTASLDRAFEVAKTYVDELAAHDFLGGQSPAERIGRIVPARDLETAVDGADLVVEAIFEDVAAKQALFKDLDAIAPLTTILASNSSRPMARMYSPFSQSSFWMSKTGPLDLTRSHEKPSIISATLNTSRSSPSDQPIRARKFSSASGR